MGIDIFNQPFHAPAICQDSDDAATVAAAAAAAAAALPLKFQPHSTVSAAASKYLQEFLRIYFQSKYKLKYYEGKYYNRLLYELVKL